MEIVKVNENHLNAFTLYADECIADGLDLYNSATDNYEAFLKKRIAYSQGNELPHGWPPISMFFCIEKGEILGAIRIRHGTNEYINNIIGHIGYETSPKARGRGIATLMLNWIKENIIEGICIVSCEINNLASQKVIQKCGGEYLNTLYSEEDDSEILRYELKRQ